MAQPELVIPTDTRQDTRRFFLVAGLFFGALLLWGSFAELHAGAIASGEVIPAGRVRTVQHLDGGIVRAILVKEGQRVAEGEELIRLDDTEAKAALEIARKELAGYEARLADAHREEAQWTARDTAIQKMVDNAEEESRLNRELYEKNFISKSRLLQLENVKAQSTALLSENAAERARARQRVSEMEAAVATARDRLSVSRERLQRTKVTAPQAGVVQGLRVTTLGAVIPPGGTLLDVVPDADELLIEARIAPDDIDVVMPGQEAHVRLTAYKARSHIRLLGKVVQVSASTFKDETSQGRPYYKARIEIHPDELKKVDRGVLTPGMLAEVQIVAGKRSAIRYLFDPILDSMRRAFHES
ncbi:HlyD family efflux transporter periplasmic adaptor subunit [Sulfuricystis thermophila]|uniref:HlyD family efflux transporter periplasmic adaptor subunit n=1 Tax=Sulfuricystis thermophila TaxID=2496847 RepID=UPI001558610F|nr:HlyD family efflux transporter periplasmic adaptor subunit [Sulfuricystis thermophila]